MDHLDDEVPDEWERVSETLAGKPDLLAARSPRGRFLREAVIALSNPDVDPEVVEIYRRIAEEWASAGRAPR